MRFWGDRRDTALEAPPCEESPLSGRPLVVGRGGRTYARRQIEGRGIASGAIGAEHLSVVLLDAIYSGAGYDSTVDFDGTSTVLGFAPSGGVYTLTREIAPSRMIVRSGVTVIPAGYRVFARELHLYGSAVIHADGGSGGDAPGGATKASGGTAILRDSDAVILGGAENGGAGGQGGETASEAGGDGTLGGSISPGLGGDGAAGIGGQASDGAGGGAGAAGTVSGTDAHWFSLMRGSQILHGGAGGGGGGGGGATAAGADGGGGGGGGAGGGVLRISVGHLYLHGWTGRISANGGQGGDGFAGSGAAGDGGQGGGGGGGVVQFLYAQITITSGGGVNPIYLARNSTVTQAQQDALGGNVTAWGGRLGNNGSGVPPSPSALIAPYGTVRVMGPEPFIPVAEIPSFSKFVRGRVHSARGFIQLSQHDKS